MARTTAPVVDEPYQDLAKVAVSFNLLNKTSSGVNNIIPIDCSGFLRLNILFLGQPPVLILRDAHRERRIGVFSRTVCTTYSRAARLTCSGPNAYE